MRAVLVCVAIGLGLSHGFAIDNGIIGEPQVQCSEDAVTFSVQTDKKFSGNIYIKGKYHSQQCRQEYLSNTFSGATFTVRIGECGMRRIRQLQPHGMNYVLVFVVNFHSQFITKIDRAYNVRCFYAQADKTVTSGLEVSMISTTELRAQTVVMPNCEYSVRSDTLNGPKIRFAQVGDRLVHRWECDNPNFGMLVKNCFVNDGEGSSVRVLDSRGCPVFTPVVQASLNYDTNLNLAYVEVWAYKFPDRSSLFFQCQIQVCNKRENECLGITPPNCPNILKSDFAPHSQPAGTVDGRETIRGQFPASGTFPNNGFNNLGGTSQLGGNREFKPFDRTNVRFSGISDERSNSTFIGDQRVSSLDTSPDVTIIDNARVGHLRASKDTRGRRTLRQYRQAQPEVSPPPENPDETLDVTSDTILIVEPGAVDEDQLPSFTPRQAYESMYCVSGPHFNFIASMFGLLTLLLLCMLTDFLLRNRHVILQGISGVVRAKADVEC